MQLGVALIASSPRATIAVSICRRWSNAAQVRIGVSGVRSSCDTIARNSSLARLAAASSSASDGHVPGRAGERTLKNVAGPRQRHDVREVLEVQPERSDEQRHEVPTPAQMVDTQNATSKTPVAVVAIEPARSSSTTNGTNVAVR